MGFEFIYAYIENLQWFFAVGFIISILILVALITMRILNEIDVDDWKSLMLFNIPVLLLFTLLVCAPSMDHIRDVRSTATAYTLSISNTPPSFLCGPSNFLFKEPISVDKQDN